MPQTPSEADLHGVEREELEIQMALLSTVWTRSLIQPDTNAVLEQLTDCDMIHVAGRGTSDHVDPFRAAFSSRPSMER